MRRLILLPALFLSTASLATPIADNVYNLHKVGWFSSVGTPCPEVCRQNSMAVPEIEQFTPPASRNFVCKAKVASYTGEIFGANYATTSPLTWLSRVCVIGLPNTTSATYSRQFMCLCVNPQ